MSRLKITFACWDYDRTRPLVDGRVRPEGIDLNYLSLPVEETFFRMLRHEEFDVAEMSLSSYVASLFQAKQRFIAIPIFTSRSFRHSCIFINVQRGIKEPRDLVGKRVGVPEYQLTANVWIRGILSERHGVPVDSVEYYTGGEEEPGRPEKLPLNLPPGIKVSPIAGGKVLSQMLENGEIDALYSPRTPSCFAKGSKNVARLFTNFQEVEETYYKDTGIFPIMHTIVIKKDLYEANPWLAQTLYKAFVEAQKIAYADLMETAALKFMLPWLTFYASQTREVMGSNFWPYGLEPNKKNLETFLRYSFEQGLAKHLLKPSEIFAPQTYESFKI